MHTVTFNLPDKAAALLEKLGASTQEAQSALLCEALESYLEDKYWGERALEAQREGYCGVEETKALLDQFRNAEN